MPRPVCPSHGEERSERTRSRAGSPSSPIADLHAASRKAEGPPLGLDQVVFNRAVIAALTRFKLVVLDVRQAGNDVEQNCARLVLGGAPPPPLATHFRGPNKDNYMKLAGPDIWRVPVDAPQYP
jgi:hypothetical protein